MKKKKMDDNRNVSRNAESEFAPSEKPVYHGRYEKESDDSQFSYEVAPMSSYQGRYAADTDTSYKTDSVEESEYFYRAKHDAGSTQACR